MWVDKLGNPIRIGDFILYAVRHGDMAALSVGKVMRLEEKAFFVLGVQEWWSWGQPTLNTRLGRLEHGDRVVVISPPDKYLALFEGEQ